MKKFFPLKSCWIPENCQQRAGGARWDCSVTSCEITVVPALPESQVPCLTWVLLLLRCRYIIKQQLYSAEFDPGLPSAVAEGTAPGMLHKIGGKKKSA